MPGSSKIWSRILVSVVLARIVVSFSIGWTNTQLGARSPARLQSTRLFAITFPSPDTSLSERLIQSLDLEPVLEIVATYASTRRGREALLGLVQRSGQPSWQTSRRRQWLAATEDEAYRTTPLRITCSQTLKQAKRQYECVAQAIELLNDKTLPSFLGESDDYDDYDDWMELPSSEWTLYHVWQAEHVLARLLDVYAWASRIRETAPLVAQAMADMDHQVTAAVHADLADAVKAIRVPKASPYAESAFRFELNPDKYPILGILQERLADLEHSKRNKKKWEELQEELIEKRRTIERGLVRAVLSRVSELDRSLNCQAALDVIFAKARCARVWNGQIPRMLQRGTVNVTNFVHPLLSLQHSVPVPVDLVLDSALLLSGPNGGGKTICLKSFGLVVVLTKLGLPIPTSCSTVSPIRVDWFDHVLTVVGDGQRVQQGQSTYTSLLQTYATILDQVRKDDDSWAMVLLDEVGSGTEAQAGGAIGQAVLEELMASNRSNVVCTTHAPRLKAWAHETPAVECASVRGPPSFKLEYGVVGESKALRAVERFTPPLPESILRRASELLQETSDADSVSTGYVTALEASLETLQERASSYALQAESDANEARVLREAMVSLSATHQQRLAQWQHRVEDCYERLQQQDSTGLEVVGGTLAELRVVQAEILSEKEKLAEQGLRFLRDNEELSQGDLVVLTSDEWESMTATVKNAFGDDVYVFPDMAPWNMGDDTVDPLVVQRWQVAVWDNDPIRLADGLDRPRRTPGARRRLDGLLQSLDEKKASLTVEAGFRSSRERKAVNKKNGKMKKKKK